MSERQIIILDTAEELFVRAAEEIAHVAGEAICMHGEFNLCLTGGTTPERTYDLLATRFELSVDWKEVQFYWGDERCVPPDDPASNYCDGQSHHAQQAQDQARPDSSHARRGQAGRMRRASTKRNCASRLNLGDGEFPRFDLMLLGLGTNCHMLSLFPGIPALHEQHRLVVAVEVDDKFAIASR